MHWLFSMAATYRPILEAFYFLASIGLFATVIIGLIQLNLVKADIKTRNKRAAVEKSIQYLQLFATELIEKIGDFKTSILQKNIPIFTGPFNEIFIFDDNCNADSSKPYLDFCNQKNNAVFLLNELEYFSAALVSGLADEELAFNPLAEFYCNTVEMLYGNICQQRKNKHSRLYSNIIRLYKIWKDRLKKIDFENQKKDIDAGMSKLTDTRIKPIGG